ncbi:MAG TPA: 2OG-Fe(II) oxygenase [Acidisoma sp.]|uniref:2OG-Fe(II) oxygenase n=1 Tax=Acidisoma sp. TaxID=1872115 RepID=UPI002C140816|nr:2OG-Fe(II) oxygenase [Acidisoma sp.]HTI03645.1 2OG-Fe(II) oxygenase [Acidisoma sp.]
MHDPGEIAVWLREAVAAAEIRPFPYPHWLPEAMLPGPVLDGICDLPLVAPEIGETQGRRETHNSSRLFFGAAAQAAFPVCRALAAALQAPETVGALCRQTGADLLGSHLRIEYCLDRDGFWLEPHTDIGAKFFTMLIYLTDPPPGEDWGTDLYETPLRHVGSAPAQRNAGLVFVPGTDTWHGFIRRPITGVRRSLIVNYVTPEWRARHELAFPDRPVSL